MTNLTLAPFLGIVLLLVMVFCGRAFRENWKEQGHGWVGKAWLYGIIAFSSFLIIAFMPLQLH